MVKETRIAFIAFTLDTDSSVGALRVVYWAEHITALAPHITCDVITTVLPPRSLIGVNQEHLVQPKSSSPLKWFIKDEGVSWKEDLEKYLTVNDLSYDVILLSGGPFIHFSIAAYLKSNLETKVILDFRDPFANNPRIENSALKRSVKSKYEKSFIEVADHVIAVNNTCLRLLNGYQEGHNNKFSVIGNGYNDTIVDSIIRKDQSEKTEDLHFVYPGKFYPDCSPTIFLDEILKGGLRYSFSYAGTMGEEIVEFKRNSNCSIYGPLNYVEVVDMLANSDVGLIFTGGKPFESTTKIYDYIGLQKAILIITEGEPLTGEIHEITKNYPKVFWSRNTVFDINIALNELAKADLNFHFENREQYSRKAGLLELIKIINTQVKDHE